MKQGLIVILSLSTILCLLSLMIGGVFGVYPARFYAFTIPFITQTLICILIAVAGLLFKSARPLLMLALVPLHGSLLVSYWFAMSRWPGGDDGPGIAWLILIGRGSYLAAAVAIVTCIATWRLIFKELRATSNQAL